MRLFLPRLGYCADTVCAIEPTCQMKDSSPKKSRKPGGNWKREANQDNMTTLSEFEQFVCQTATAHEMTSPLSM
jgi:hypothetical protein